MKKTEGKSNEGGKQ